jgi:undecaprenyl-diphosphatase
VVIAPDPSSAPRTPTNPVRDAFIGRDRGFLYGCTIVGALTLAGGAVAFAIHPPAGVDRWSEHRDPVGQPWRGVAHLLDAIGNKYVATALVIAGMLCCRAARRRADVVLVGLGSIAAPATAEILKPLVGRRIHQCCLSYPSGHVALATAWALSLAVGAAISWAVIVLNIHYPTDALGGAATAFAVVPSIALVLDRVGRPVRPDHGRPLPRSRRGIPDTW